MRELLWLLLLLQLLLKLMEREAMTRKEKMNLVLSKVAEDKKEAFIAELREAKTPEERLKLVKKYNVTLTEDELKAVKAKNSNKLSDAELDNAAGGCSCAYVHCECTGCV